MIVVCVIVFDCSTRCFNRKTRLATAPEAYGSISRCRSEPIFSPCTSEPSGLVKKERRTGVLRETERRTPPLYWPTAAARCRSTNASPRERCRGRDTRDVKIRLWMLRTHTHTLTHTHESGSKMASHGGIVFLLLKKEETSGALNRKESMRDNKQLFRENNIES